MAKRPYAAIREGADGDPEGTPRGMEPFVLLGLADGPVHGYELAHSIASVGFRRAAEDPSVLYKLLRAFESQGLAASAWTDGDGGPPRRMYTLTRDGEAYLHARASDLRRQAKRIQEFAARYQAWTKRATRRSRKSSSTKRAEGGS
jgi:DNA-binding PadR family transcriptional regulator